MVKASPIYVEKLLDLVNTSSFCQHMRLRLVSIDFDEAVVELDAGTPHIQPLGTVHGGVLATLIDTATYWAGFLQIPEDAGLVTVDLKLNYLKPGATGLLISRARCLKGGRTISYAEASVENEAGDLLAHGTSTLMVLPGQGLPINVNKFDA